MTIFCWGAIVLKSNKSSWLLISEERGKREKREKNHVYVFFFISNKVYCRGTSSGHFCAPTNLFNSYIFFVAVLKRPFCEV